MKLAVPDKLVRLLAKLKPYVGFGGPPRHAIHRRAEYNRMRTRRFYFYAAILHICFVVPSLISIGGGCLYEVPAGVPMGKGDKLTKGKEMRIQIQKQVVRRKRRVRQSPVSIYEMLKDEDLQQQKQVNAQFSDFAGVPGGIGEGACAAGSPRGTAVGGKLYFYRVKFNGPDWDANSSGVRPLMKEVLKAGVVKSVSGFNNNVSLADLPKHSGKYFPALLYMTGTGAINANDQEVSNMRNYLLGGGMLFADVSGGSFHQAFTQFIRRVLPEYKLETIEFDNEIYRGGNMPYAMLHGCPVYRKHEGAGPAQGMWVGPRISVFYSRGDLGSAWASAGIFQTRRRDVEQAYRMGINIITYSLLYYKVISADGNS